MRPIDADALKRKVFCSGSDYLPARTKTAVNRIIDNAPTIEPQGDYISRADAIPSAEAVQGWIPCSEKLPNAKYGESNSVLCCTETGLMYILYWNGGNWCVPTGEPHEWVNHKTGWHDKVIAWMPLPDPYKERNE